MNSPPWNPWVRIGIRNILHSEWQDTVWSAPALLNEHMTSASDEIYPMLSPDGSKMYFSSVGLYGVGGYDIYVSERDSDTGDWSMPVNMGFPYSSPADDFLFMNTPDGEYSLFSSVPKRMAELTSQKGDYPEWTDLVRSCLNAPGFFLVNDIQGPGRLVLSCSVISDSL